MSSIRHVNVHPECEKFIEFMFGPLGIGDDVKIKPDEVRIKGQTCKSISIRFYGSFGSEFSHAD